MKRKVSWSLSETTDAGSRVDFPRNIRWLRNIVLLCIIILRDIFVVHRLLAPVSLADGEWVGEKGWLEIVCCIHFDVIYFNSAVVKNILCGLLSCVENG